MCFALSSLMVGRARAFRACASVNTNAKRAKNQRAYMSWLPQQKRSVARTARENTPRLFFSFFSFRRNEKKRLMFIGNAAIKGIHLLLLHSVPSQSFCYRIETTYTSIFGSSAAEFRGIWRLYSVMQIKAFIFVIL